MVEAGHFWVEGGYLKWVDAYGSISMYTGTQRGTMATPGFVWVEGMKICYVDSTGQVRCFVPGISVQQFYANLGLSPSLSTLIPIDGFLGSLSLLALMGGSTNSQGIPTMSSVPTLEVITPLEASYGCTPTMGYNWELWDSVTGAMSEYGSVHVGETVAANNATINDMTLMRATPTATDKYYFGYSQPYKTMLLTIDTAGAGVWSTIWEYWDGAAWQTLPGMSDPTNGFRPAGAGTYRLFWTVPTAWIPFSIGTVVSGTMYWCRSRLDAFTSKVTIPKGSRVWILNSTGTLA